MCPQITEKIANGAITQAKLSFTPPSVARPITPPVTTDEIANAAITPAKLSFSVPSRPLVPPVATAEIADSAVTTAKIAANAITGAKIASGAVGSSEIAANAVGTSELAAGAVTTDKIGNGQVTPAKLSFTPAGLTPTTTVTLLNESSADEIDQVINLDAYIPAGANFALLQLRSSAGQLMASPTVSAVIWDDYVTEPVFLANLNQGMIEGSVVTQSGPVRLYGPSAPARAIRVAHIKNGQIAVTQVYLYGYA